MCRITVNKLFFSLVSGERKTPCGCFLLYSGGAWGKCKSIVVSGSCKSMWVWDFFFSRVSYLILWLPFLEMNEITLFAHYFCYHFMQIYWHNEWNKLYPSLTLQAHQNKTNKKIKLPNNQTEGQPGFCPFCFWAKCELGPDQLHLCTSQEQNGSSDG